jgi:hypothetical protein
VGLLDFLFGGKELPDIEDYLQQKQGEAAEWREEQWQELRARQQRIEDLNDQLLHLRDQAEGR